MGDWAVSCVLPVRVETVSVIGHVTIHYVILSNCQVKVWCRMECHKMNVNRTPKVTVHGNVSYKLVALFFLYVHTLCQLCSYSHDYWHNSEVASGLVGS